MSAKKHKNKTAVANGRKGGRRPAPEGEDNAARFRRVANERVNGLLDNISKLRNLANKQVYESTPEQLDVIENALTQAVHEAVAVLRGSAGKAGFSL